MYNDIYISIIHSESKKESNRYNTDNSANV